MLPLDHDLFNFGSWMGGDRDGNPFVTPEATREVVLTARMAAVNEYERAIEKLMYELSVWRCNDELKVRCQACSCCSVLHKRTLQRAACRTLTCAAG